MYLPARKKEISGCNGGTVGGKIWGPNPLPLLKPALLRSGGGTERVKTQMS